MTITKESQAEHISKTVQVGTQVIDCRKKDTNQSRTFSTEGQCPKGTVEHMLWSTGAVSLVICKALDERTATEKATEIVIASSLFLAGAIIGISALVAGVHDHVHDVPAAL